MTDRLIGLLLYCLTVLEGHIQRKAIRRAQMEDIRQKLDTLEAYIRELQKEAQMSDALIKKAQRDQRDRERASEIVKSLTKDPVGTMGRLMKSLVYSWGAGFIAGVAVTAIAFLI